MSLVCFLIFFFFFFFCVFVCFIFFFFFFFFQAEDGIRDLYVTGVQTCALPILGLQARLLGDVARGGKNTAHLSRIILEDRGVEGNEELLAVLPAKRQLRSEEHTSELQSRRDLVCRLLLEKKNISDD